MMDVCASILFVLFNVVFGCHMPPWVLKRGDPGSSSVSFFNDTLSNSHMMVRWTWMDSSRGLWDTRLRVMLNNEEIIGGGFTYSDEYGNELASVRWFRIKMSGPIKWLYKSFESPPDSWWMTSVMPRGENITWGFKNQITDGSWVFRVGNDTLEPKNAQKYDTWSQSMGTRMKRSLQQNENDDQSLNAKSAAATESQNPPVSYEDDDEGGEDFFQSIIGYFMEFFQIFKSAGDIFTKIGM